MKNIKVMSKMLDFEQKQKIEELALKISKAKECL